MNRPEPNEHDFLSPLIVEGVDLSSWKGTFNQAVGTMGQMKRKYQDNPVMSMECDICGIKHVEFHRAPNGRLNLADEPAHLCEECLEKETQQSPPQPHTSPVENNHGKLPPRRHSENR